MILRAFTIQLTIFPTLKTKALINRKFLKVNGNNDYMYSGHTCLLTTSLFILTKNNHLDYRLSVLYGFLAGYNLARLKQHYSCDVGVSWIISLLWASLYYSNDNIRNYLI